MKLAPHRLIMLVVGLLWAIGIGRATGLVPTAHAEARVARIWAKALFHRAGPSALAKDEAGKVRKFLFTYSATVTGVPPGETAHIWLPVPPSGQDQEVRIISKTLPGESRMGRESKYGNEILYLEAKAGPDGKIPVGVTYEVKRHEVKADLDNHGKEDGNLESFLQADAKVPVGGKTLELLKDKSLPADQLEAARTLYDVVNQHMRYSKEGTGWGEGDAVWACASGYGNCSDFHSLFISLARADKIPSKFEIGFPLPPKRGAGDIAGYHCWAKFHPAGHGWIPVDISEANKNPKLREYYFGNLTEDRVAFSTGRDLTLVPPQAGKPLNFFVFPYVELNGRAYPQEKIQRKFSYKDLPANDGK